MFRTRPTAERPPRPPLPKGGRRWLVLVVALSSILHLLSSILLEAADPRPHPHLTLASLAPTREWDQYGPDWILSWDGSRRSPLWTLERLTKESFGESKRGDQKFYHDKRELRECPTSPDDWNGFTQKWDRFHLAAARNHSGSADFLKLTFTDHNAAVGDKVLNEGIWRLLEDHVASLVADDKTVVWVLTICVWNPEPSDNRELVYREHSIGANHRRVPPAFAKAVLVQRHAAMAMHTWLVPNAEPPERATIERYLVSVDDLEARCGNNLWPGLPDEDQKRLEAAP